MDRLLSAVSFAVVIHWGERDEGRAHLGECRHGFVGAADLDLVEEGLGVGAVFAGALRCVERLISTGAREEGEVSGA